MNAGFIRRSLQRLSWRAQRSDRHLVLGARGERAAARLLKRCHYRIIARNYRCSAGEIDLIALDGDTVVFVEIKTRSSDERQDPQEAVRPAQWRKLERAARCFLAKRSAQQRPCRFDLVTVVWPSRGSPLIEHFEDAHLPRR